MRKKIIFQVFFLIPFLVFGTCPVAVTKIGPVLDNGVIWGTNAGNSKEQQQQWAYSYTLPEPDFATIATVRETQDGGFIAGANTNGQVWILKLGSQGEIQWQKKYVEVENSGIFCQDIKQTTDGCYIICGTAVILISGAPLLPCYGWLMKINENGDILWQKGYYFEGNTGFTVVTETKDGCFLIGGYGRALGQITPQKKPLVLKVDENGAIIWRWFLDTGDEALGDDSEVSTLCEEENSYLVGGNIISRLSGDPTQETDGSDIFLARFSGEGNLIWEKVYRGQGWDILSSVRKTAADGFILAGMTGPWGYGYGFLMQIEEEGDIRWAKGYNTSTSSGFTSVLVTDDGGFVSGGLYALGGCLVRTDSSGNPLWQKRYSLQTNYVAPASGAGYVVGSFPNQIMKTSACGESCLCFGDLEMELLVPDFVVSSLVLYAYPFYNSPDFDAVVTAAVPFVTKCSADDICPKWLNVSFDGAGSGTVDVRGSLFNQEITVTSRENFSQRFDANSAVTITAYPDDGCVFFSWGADASGSGNPIMLTMDNDKDIVARFERKADISGEGTVDIFDVILCLRMAVGLDPVNIQTADMNSDGVVDISDVILILRKAIGLN